MVHCSTTRLEFVQKVFIQSWVTWCPGVVKHLYQKPLAFLFIIFLNCFKENQFGRSTFPSLNVWWRLPWVPKPEWIFCRLRAYFRNSAFTCPHSVTSFIKNVSRDQICTKRTFYWYEFTVSRSVSRSYLMLLLRHALGRDLRLWRILRKLPPQLNTPN